MSMTEYLYRLTVAVPESLTIPANHLSVAIGEGPGDFYCFGNLNYQDANGVKYSVISTAATPRLFEYAGSPLQRRDFAPEDWSKTKAETAQAALLIYQGEGDIPKAQAGKIVVIADMEPFSAIAEMGLTLREVDFE